VTASVYGAVSKVSKAGDTMTGQLTVEAGISGTEAITAGVVTLAYSPAITPDAQLGGHFRVTLTGNPAINAPTSPADGQKITLEVVQDATGGRTVTWGTGIQFGAAGAPTLSTAAGKRDVLGFLYSAAAGSGAGAWLCTGPVTGF
jgi:hypothetical protein